MNDKKTSPIIRGPFKMVYILWLCSSSILLCAHDFSGPQGTSTIEWSAENISRVTSSGYGDSFGMETLAKLGPAVVETVDSHRCVVGSYLLFDINDDFAFDIDEPIEIELLIDRRGNDSITVAYDRNGLVDSRINAVLPGKHHELVKQTLVLERARFANRGEAGSDLILAGSSAYYPGVPDNNHAIAVCGLTLRRPTPDTAVPPTGAFKLTLADENGKPTTARIGLYDASGRMPLPSIAALEIPVFADRRRQIMVRGSLGEAAPWPHDNRYVFYIDSTYETELPNGEYTLILSRGPEYRVLRQNVTIDTGSTTELSVQLKRFVNMPERGWYSGDDHVHIGRQHKDNKNVLRLMQAEDLHLTNLLQMGNPAETHFTQYAFGKEGHYFDNTHGLVSGVEDPRTAIRGHTISLNIDRVLRPQDTYLLYDSLFAEYREQGAISGYAHVAEELFNVARGLALHVPLGGVDFVEVLQYNVLGTLLWYDFLHLGFKLVPTAGSDFPYINLPGTERNYVYTGSSFSPEAWFANLKAGRTFVTNGPMLSFDAGDHSMGDTIQAIPGDIIKVRASALLNPDIDTLDRLELIVRGGVVHSVDSDRDAQSLELEYDITVDRGFWMAVRAYGKAAAVAHSAPIYVVTDKSGFRTDGFVHEIVDWMQKKLDEYQYVVADTSQELETWAVGPNLEMMLSKQREAILERVDKARLIYDAITAEVKLTPLAAIRLFATSYPAIFAVFIAATVAALIMLIWSLRWMRRR